MGKIHGGYLDRRAPYGFRKSNLETQPPRPANFEAERRNRIGEEMAIDMGILLFEFAVIAIAAMY